ncbi:LptF/LptG family permease [Defluviicoccus vanus]|uniref:YjgP/YjgQ family permease n=1 Tax=Defluviicoccus vanus TaxID=111831 RepID=A0A7H1MZS9_9PROT|nr:LptF/LptG family permease [Defluviicoccus vanus]QNT68965.1 YjgP/YjgQ family permease [Defluviicoccus vanus]
MNTLDFYVVRRIIKPLAIALFVAVLVLLLERLLRLLDIILGSEGPVGIFFQIMAYLAPEYAGLALPMSLLLGVMLGFNQLSRDGEVDALQASGVGVRRQARPAILVGLVITVAAGIIVGYLKPFSRYAYQSVVYAATETALNVLLRPHVFAEIGAMTVFIDGIRPETGTFTDVFLYERHNSGDSVVITARDGDLTRAQEDGTPMLRLFDGIRVAVGAKSSQPAANGNTGETTVGVLHFNELRTAMTGENAGLFRPRGGDRREYTLDELWTLRMAPPEGVRLNDLISELNHRLVQMASIPFIPLLAVALGLAGGRRTDRIYGIAAGLLIIIAYNQILDLGKNLVQGGDVGPFIALWLPMLLFAAVSLWSFHRVAERVPRQLVPILLSAVSERLSWLRKRQAADTDTPAA